mmetsp:Transcript_8298/g.12685  ORF Transcript_8298/g.12685 Transcript_8298/m.12685 type:complete len:126 (-) Transcript_8298:809-1186(-)
MKIDRTILCKTAWQKDSPVVRTVESLMDASPEEQEENKGKMAPFNFFFNRVLKQAANITMELAERLNIKIELAEVVWATIKSIISCEPLFLVNRHIDQVIMCTLYAIVKVSGGPKVDFNSIITTY